MIIDILYTLCRCKKVRPSYVRTHTYIHSGKLSKDTYEFQAFNWIRCREASYFVFSGMKWFTRQKYRIREKIVKSVGRVFLLSLEHNCKNWVGYCDIRMKNLLFRPPTSQITIFSFNCFGYWQNVFLSSFLCAIYTNFTSPNIWNTAPDCVILCQIVWKD